jgi:putative ABC transport system ATP-binding protein
MKESKPLIMLENVSKVYKTNFVEFKALDGIDLEINENDFISLIGPSGSGKSTLMNILGCMDHLTSGKYFYKDHNIEKFSEDKMANFRNEKVGFIFQSFNLLKNLSVLENVLLPLEFAQKYEPYEKILDRAEKILTDLKILDKCYSSVQALSGGQMQRVAIAAKGCYCKGINKRT